MLLYTGNSNSVRVQHSDECISDTCIRKCTNKILHVFQISCTNCKIHFTKKFPFIYLGNTTYRELVRVHRLYKIGTLLYLMPPLRVDFIVYF